MPSAILKIAKNLRHLPGKRCLASLSRPPRSQTATNGDAKVTRSPRYEAGASRNAKVTRSPRSETGAYGNAKVARSPRYETDPSRYANVTRSTSSETGANGNAIVTRSPRYETGVSRNAKVTRSLRSETGAYSNAIVTRSPRYETGVSRDAKVTRLPRYETGASRYANITRLPRYEAGAGRDGKLPKKIAQNLLLRVSPLGNPSMSIVPVLDDWAREVREINRQKVRSVIKFLQSHRRYSHALEVSEWLSSKNLDGFSPDDFAMQLDLIGKIRGVEAAEKYFNRTGGVDEKDMEKVYCTLLFCYVRERLVDKSVSLFQRMKDLRFLSTLAFNNMLILYKDTDQVDKIPEVLSEMRKTGYLPDANSYKISIEAYGAKSDLYTLEIILKEMESQRNIFFQWSTYSLMAGFYIKAGDRGKALIHLKKCEDMVGKDSVGYDHLISHYADLGDKKKMMKLWELQKGKCNLQLNRNYVVIIRMLVKLGELKEAEDIFEDWELSCKLYDFQVPNLLLQGYCQKGLTKKAESTLDKIIAKGKTPIPDSWSIVATGYLGEKNMNKAFECFKKAVALQTESWKFTPEPTMVMAILDWLANSRDVKEVEAFIDLTKSVMPVSIEMYRVLIKAFIRSGGKADRVLEMMKSDGIAMEEETEKIVKAQAV